MIFYSEVLPEKVAEVIESSLPCVAVLVTCWVWVMGVGDGRQGIQPEFTPRLMMTAVQGQAVAKGNSHSMLTLRCTVRWKEEQEKEGERQRRRNREGKGKEGRLEFNQTSKANFYVEVVE